MHLVSASIDSWQPTINTVALIVLGLVGNREFKKHKKKLRRSERREELYLSRLEKQIDSLVHRVEQILETSNPKFGHLQ